MTSTSKKRKLITTTLTEVTTAVVKKQTPSTTTTTTTSELRTRSRRVYNELVGLDPLMVIPTVVLSLISEYADNKRLVVLYSSNFWLPVDGPKFGVVESTDHNSAPTFEVSNVSVGAKMEVNNGVYASMGGYLYRHYHFTYQSSSYCNGKRLGPYNQMIRFDMDNSDGSEGMVLKGTTTGHQTTGWISALNNNLYMGANDFSDYKQTYIIDVYDPTRDSWTTVDNARLVSAHGHEGGRSVAINSRLIVCSGHRDTTMETWDPRSNLDWKLLAPIPNWRQDFSMLATPSEHTFIVVGGSTWDSGFAFSSHKTSDPKYVFEYDTRNNQWLTHDQPTSVYRPIPIPHHAQYNDSAAFIDNTLVYFSSGDSANMHYYHQQFHQWIPMFTPFRCIEHIVTAVI